MKRRKLFQAFILILKKTGYIILGLWCILVSFFSPIWLTLIFLDITGLIYKYDFSMEEGIAPILGIMELIIWLLLALLPGIFFLKRIKSVNGRAAVIVLVMMVLAAILCAGMCGWDIVRFLTVPGGSSL